MLYVSCISKLKLEREVNGKFVSEGIGLPTPKTTLIPSATKVTEPDIT